MARPRKDYKILSCRIERSIYEQLDKFCERSGQAKTVAVERILGSYFQDYFSHKDNTVKNNTIR
ncbi:MAG: hypothetical protein K2N31_09830 [Treponemataceae bacterium]|nr:hypothetical protein [Treponemataceae bacterium]